MSSKTLTGGPEGRLAGLDVCRGLAISLVVVHHVTGAALGSVSPTGRTFLLLLTANRLTQCVVPTFLFVSALVFSLLVSRPFGWRRYASSRLRQLFWPYLLWTALYLGFQGLTGSGPAAGDWLVTYGDAGLLKGKGYFHLYYLLLALQLALLFPLIRRFPWRAWPVPWVMSLAVAIQLGLYTLNLRFLHLNNVGSSVLWYVLPLALGLTLGAVPGRFERVWSRWRWEIVAACLLALAVYLPLGFAEVLHTPLQPLAYSCGNWAYTTLAALVLGGLGTELVRRGGRVQDALGRLGQLSLQIYLLHPALLWGLERLWFPRTTTLNLLTVALYTVLGLGLPYALALSLDGRRASVWLFGR